MPTLSCQAACAHYPARPLTICLPGDVSWLSKGVAQTLLVYFSCGVLVTPMTYLALMSPSPDQKK